MVQGSWCACTAPGQLEQLQEDADLLLRYRCPVPVRSGDLCGRADGQSVLTLYPSVRHALLNFNTFIKAWIPLASEADWQLPHLPAKDVVHWIYRDVRCEFQSGPPPGDGQETYGRHRSCPRALTQSARTRRRTRRTCARTIRALGGKVPLPATTFHSLRTDNRSLGAEPGPHRRTS